MPVRQWLGLLCHSSLRGKKFLFKDLVIYMKGRLIERRKRVSERGWERQRDPLFTGHNHQGRARLTLGAWISIQKCYMGAGD